MPYTNASDARIGTNQVRSNITHINSLIDAEVAKGGECIVVGPTLLTDCGAHFANNVWAPLC